MIDDAFGHWLAGFIDGEGSFTIHRRVASGRRAGGQYSCRLSIGLRADDAEILLEIQRRLGLGFITSGWTKAGNKAPQRTWVVSSKADCTALVAVLDCYPLRAKKARDYALWREAVVEWGSVVGHGRARRNDWTRVAELKEALETGRRYEGPAEPPVVTVVEQLPLIP